MRSYFLIILASLLSVAIGYESGKEYLYKIEGYVYSGIRNTKPQLSGTASIADVLIQVNKNDYIIQIKDIKFDVVNDLFTTQFEKYPFDYKEVSAFSEQISKPFKVVIEHGLISQFYIPEDEPDWSISLKKSFLNLLQLCLDHKKDSHAHKDEDENFYILSEKGSFGECETTYQIRSDPTISGTDQVFNVTKIRNYDKCIKRPHPFVYSSSPGTPCDDCEFTSKKNFWQASSIFDYNVKGNRDTYVIEKITQREFIISAPFGQDGRIIEFRTRRILELVQVKDITETLVIADNVNPDTDLTSVPLKNNEFFDKIDLRKAHYLYDILRYQAEVSQLVTLFDQVVDDYAKSKDADGVNCPLPSKFGELVDLLSTLDHDEIEKIHKAVWEKSKHHKKLFLDVLATSGTNPAFVFAKTLIEQKTLKDVYSDYKLLQKLTLNIKEPSEALFNEYYQLCTGNAAKECKKFKRACYLSFSSLVSQECVQKHRLQQLKQQHHSHHHHLHHKKTTKIADHSTHHCSPEVASKYFKLLVKPDVEEKSEHELGLLIRTASNFRAKESVDYLKKVIDGNHHHHLRSTAAWGLVAVAKQSHESLAPIVAQHFFDKNEETDIRLAAFVSWFWGMSFTDMQLIAKHLITEENRQVVNFVYTTFKSLVDSKLPCHQLKKMQRNVRSVLWVYKIAYDRHGGKIKWGDSRNYYYTRFNNEYNFGAARQISIIASNRSYIPQSVYISSKEIFSGYAFESFAVHIQTYGIEKVINRLFGHKGTYWKKTSFFDLFKKRVSRDASSVDAEIKKIEKALPVETRDFEEVHADITLKINGYQLSYFEFDEELFSSVIKDGAISIPDIQKVLSTQIGPQELSGFYQPFEYFILLQNEIGIPYFYRYRSLSRVKVENNKFSLNVIPSLFSEDRENKPPSEIQVSSDIKLDRHTDTVITGGHILPVVSRKVGVGFHRRTVTRIPISGDLSYKSQERKITFKHIPTANDIFYDKNTPFTFIDTYSNTIPLVSEPEFKPIYKDSNLKKVERNYLKNYFGYGLKINWISKPIDKAEIYKFYSEKSFGERIDYYTYQPKGIPYELKLSSVLAEENPTTELKVSLSCKDNDKADENELVNDFDEDSAFKDYTESRKDRQAHSHVVRVEINGSGNIQRTVLGEYKHSYSRDRLYHKVDFHYDRSPINDNGYKICAVASVKFPDYDLTKFVNLDTLELDHTVNMTGKLSFGQSCENNAKITIKAQASQSTEQKRLERSRDILNPDQPNPYAAAYLRCKNSNRFKWDSLPFCHSYLSKITEMRHLVASVDYENIPDRFANFTMKLFRKRVYQRYQYTDIKISHDLGNPGHIQYESTASAIVPKVDFKIYAPHFTAFFENVPYTHLPPITTYPLYNWKYSQTIYDVEPQPFCVIQGKVVRTLDNVTYALPPIDNKCETLIAKDCSPEHNFMVVGSKVDEKVSLKVYLSHKFKIELVPSKNDLAVHVNGKKINVLKSEPYSHIVKHGTREVELFSVTFNGVYYQLSAKVFGLNFLVTDGTGVGLEISRYFTGKTCGICGDNNRDRNNEFRGANGKIHKTANPFVYSYVIPNSDCSPPVTSSENELVSA